MNTTTNNNIYGTTERKLHLNQTGFVAGNFRRKLMEDSRRSCS